MIRKIVQSGSPVLRTKSKAVNFVDKKIKDLVKDLKETLAVQKDPEGIGLAAPQIGRNLQVFVCKYKNFSRVVINPKILEIDDKRSDDCKKKTKREILEGCLSLPNYYGPLKRSKKVKVEYLNEFGKKITEEFEDFNAQIILHEIDHLNGVLFIDHLLNEKRPLYKVEGDEWEEVELIK